MLLGAGRGCPAALHSLPHLRPNRPHPAPGTRLCSMRPQLVLMLSALLPVEARLSYLGLRHAAYAAPGEAAIQSGHSIS